MEVTCRPRPRARVDQQGAELYFDFAVADLARHQLMDVEDHPELRAQLPRPYAGLAGGLFDDEHLPPRMSDPDDIDVYTALISGLVAQQLANDRGGAAVAPAYPPGHEHVRR